MIPAARIQTTIEVLEKIDASRIPMDSTIGDYMRHRRYIGAKDRSNIAERLYNIVRHHARLSWWMKRLHIPPEPRTAVIVWLMLGEMRNENAVRRIFDGSKHGAPSLLDNEEKYLAALAGHTMEHPDMPQSVRVECPPEKEEALRALFGADFAAEMEAMLKPATLDLRVNTRLTTREEAQKSLRADGAESDFTPYSPWGLRLREKTHLSKTKAFVKGLVEIQDEGSQLVAYICNAKAGMQVLDYCAGAGGKTLALAAAMQNKGRIVAMDSEKARLEKSRARFRRAGVADIIEVRPLSDEKNRKWLRRQEGTFDVVLIDAPCSSSGTWRRNPDLRWRTYGPSLEDIMTAQREILDKVAKTVKPDGRLVYATCSLFREENEDQIEAFLSRHPEFAVMTVEQAWPEGSAAPVTGNYLRLTPGRHHTDGFFAAVLTRAKTA